MLLGPTSSVVVFVGGGLGLVEEMRVVCESKRSKVSYLLGLGFILRREEVREVETMKWWYSWAS